jgi:hypothetical protein
MLSGVAGRFRKALPGRWTSPGKLIMLGGAVANPCFRAFTVSISSARLFVLLALLVLAPAVRADVPGFPAARIQQALQAAERSHDLQAKLPGVETPASPDSEETEDQPVRLKAPKWISELLGTVGELLFWGLVIAAAALIVLAIVRNLPFIADRLRRRRGKQEVSVRPVSAAPSRAVAAVLLDDADRLAASGQYAEAVRLLLFRTIDDISRRMNRSMPAALTSREILDGTALTPDGRAAFDDIVVGVELSYFGGRDFGAGDYARCRGAYERFALAGAAV